MCLLVAMCSFDQSDFPAKGGTMLLVLHCKLSSLIPHILNIVSTHHPGSYIYYVGKYPGEAEVIEL